MIIKLFLNDDTQTCIEIKGYKDFSDLAFRCNQGDFFNIPYSNIVNCMPDSKTKSFVIPRASIFIIKEVEE